MGQVKVFGHEGIVCIVLFIPNKLPNYIHNKTVWEEGPGNTMPVPEHLKWLDEGRPKSKVSSSCMVSKVRSRAILMRDSDPYLADNSPVPEAEEEVSSAAMMESDGDLPVQDESEGLGSDTDLDDLADAPKQSNVEHFASMLWEAQCIAVEIKRHEVEQKKKMPKTYQGNSKKTLYRCENTWKALASKGFLDIVTFMALKGVQVQGADESVDSDMLEVDASMHKVEEGHTVPSRHSDLGRSSGYRQSGGRRVVVVEEEEEEEEGEEEDVVKDTPAHTNMLEVERRGGPSVSSESLGLAHFGYQ